MATCRRDAPSFFTGANASLLAQASYCGQTLELGRMQVVNWPFLAGHAVGLCVKRQGSLSELAVRWLYVHGTAVYILQVIGAATSCQLCLCTYGVWTVIPAVVIVSQTIHALHLVACNKLQLSIVWAKQRTLNRPAAMFASATCDQNEQ